MGRLEPAGAGEPGGSDLPWGRGRPGQAAQDPCHSPGEGAAGPAPAQAPLPWVPPSLFAAFIVVLLLVLSGLFFAFPCRWLAQNGEWAFPIITGPLFVLTFVSLVSLNFSNPGILHQGSNEQGPTAVHVISVNRKAFRLQWCQRCCFHRPPRTHHCGFCNVCVEDFDHHCQWVNNCIGHRNFRRFLLLVLSFCLYSGAVLVTCLIFLLRPSQETAYIDRVMAILVAVPAAGFLAPLCLLLLILAMSVSAAERSCEGKCRDLCGYNPFDQGCASNWYLAICAPLGPKYMAKAVLLQRVVEPDRALSLSQNLHCPTCPWALGPAAAQGPASGQQPPPPALHRPGTAPPGSGEAAAPQELHAGPALLRPPEAPR
uniref:Palmitoyltransferase n=1 Tax=Pipistrellus kuhlii TaxID=59472 RepID=A0A7J8ACG3_PIPKU|nr:zinc finger DHHC-type palmitoyltransferase 19 [Pipistrellus kuhlii]